MNRFERIGLTMFFIAMLGILAQCISYWRFPDDPQMAMLLSIRNLVTAVLFAVIYNTLPVSQEKKE